MVDNNGEKPVEMLDGSNEFSRKVRDLGLGELPDGLGSRDTETEAIAMAPDNQAGGAEIDDARDRLAGLAQANYEADLEARAVARKERLRVGQRVAIQRQSSENMWKQSFLRMRKALKEAFSWISRGVWGDHGTKEKPYKGKILEERKPWR